jgi:large subunit ribosomal protein L23
MAEKNIFKHIVRPIMTERSTMLKETLNQYVFEVPKASAKGEIKEAIEEIFKVTVNQVRTIRMPGKFRRYGRGGGYRSDWKKAIVTLKKGDSINLVEQAA